MRAAVTFSLLASLAAGDGCVDGQELSCGDVHSALQMWHRQRITVSPAPVGPVGPARSARPGRPGPGVCNHIVQALAKLESSKVLGMCLSVFSRIKCRKLVAKLKNGKLAAKAAAALCREVDASVKEQPIALERLMSRMEVQDGALVSHFAALDASLARKGSDSNSSSAYDKAAKEPLPGENGYPDDNGTDIDEDNNGTDDTVSTTNTTEEPNTTNSTTNEAPVQNGTDDDDGPTENGTESTTTNSTTNKTPVQNSTDDKDVDDDAAAPDDDDDGDTDDGPTENDAE
eukprot:gnl/TRDRNA2_/TRDRNA2_134360_c0_seq1.p1 gnl/TRDRNA2_/TRDRNA2_134360_c0~~gnl/TRDRNA2_/TRDRNA2_134360_c0_seq1.p1  ORF type:complete len:287 (+),score=51.89 gnl/TRDRNA2_/TRDRNA2_134360_c0_seq1:139-999(+)